MPFFALVNVWAPLQRPGSLYAEHKESESQSESKCKVQCQDTGAQKLFQCQRHILHLALMLVPLAVKELALQVCWELLCSFQSGRNIGSNVDRCLAIEEIFIFPYSTLLLFFFSFFFFGWRRGVNKKAKDLCARICNVKCFALDIYNFYYIVYSRTLITILSPLWPTRKLQFTVFSSVCSSSNYLRFIHI